MAHQYADAYVHDPRKMPKTEHWAILGQSSVHIPGDQRSIDAPGHGYPASTEYYITYEVYNTEAKFTEALAYKLLQRENVHGIHVTGEAFTLEAKVVSQPQGERR